MIKNKYTISNNCLFSGGCNSYLAVKHAYYNICKYITIEYFNKKILLINYDINDILYNHMEIQEYN